MRRSIRPKQANTRRRYHPGGARVEVRDAAWFGSIRPWPRSWVRFQGEIQPRPGQTTSAVWRDVASG
jgi:hypothetical protein